MCQSPSLWALTQINEAPSPHQDRPKVVHIGVRGSGDDQVAQRLKEAVSIVALQMIGHFVPQRGRAGNKP